VRHDVTLLEEDVAPRRAMMARGSSASETIIRAKGRTLGTMGPRRA